ncbi:MAG: helix-turn-helix domain-containing protein [Geobacteraceae bacterium]|nr:helix-turn-helix domain-containing protein [Geobacteraceae bacterium]
MSSDSIAVIAFDRISMFHLAIPLEVFGEDRRDAGVPLIPVTVCACEKRSLTTSAGFVLGKLHGMRMVETAGIVIVPSWRDPHELPPEALLKALRKAYRRGALMVGLCLGSYVLAAAGLLDGRPATTHWKWADDLVRRYPEIQVKRDVLYVDDGDIITSAGVAAGIDCCLHLLRRMHGAEIASRVARRMVVPPHRQGGQAQYIEPLRESPLSDRFSEVVEWVQQHPEMTHTLDSLAAKAFMSRRTFTRRFRQVTGTTVGSWLLNQRLSLARRLLETSTASIDLVAQRAGFGSEVSLRKHFRKVLRTAPGRYRKEFRES